MLLNHQFRRLYFNMSKIALVHDYLREYGGAERVLEALHEIFPQAPVYTAFVDSKAMGKNWHRFANWDIRQSKITQLPFYKKLFSPMRIFAKWAFEQLDLSEYDLVISSSNAYFAKAVKVPNGKHLCYCHTPPRVLYGYSAKSNWRSNPFTLFAGNLLNHFVRQMDFVAAQNPDVFIANSEETKLRIKKFYKRDSTVINPPIKIYDQAKTFFDKLNKKDLADFTQQKNSSYYLYVNRLAKAKHPELAVQVASELNLKLKVVGDGAMLEDLKEMAGETIEFLGAVDDKKLIELYKNARALLYPVEDEDFGMVPVEAMAFGTPVIAHQSGGPKETIKQDRTGLFFKSLTVESLAEAIIDFEKNFICKPLQIHQSSKIYSFTTFKEKLQKLILA
ncbi:MAG TPA: glycosyl transferase [Candidatus Pacebacteria bacterium]|nr:glycosyl transferase [Candidatus Paceibacterota bacterium]